MDTMSDTHDFITKGAEVVLYSVTLGHPYPRKTTVRKVNPKTFEVAGSGRKFSRSSLMTPDRPIYAVCAPDSDKAAELWKQAERHRLRDAAQRAVDEWNTGNGRDDLRKLNAAVEALAAYGNYGMES